MGREGVYKWVFDLVYFRVYYTSIAANDVKTFECPYRSDKEMCSQAPNIHLPEFKFGSLVVDGKNLPDDLSEVDDTLCTQLVRSAIKIELDDQPELYINLSIKLQLESFLEGKDFVIVSQGIGTVETYNPYRTTDHNPIWLFGGKVMQVKIQNYPL